MDNNNLLLAVLAALAVAIAVLAIARLVSLIGRARVYAHDLQTCGFLPEPPDDSGQARMMRLSRLFVRLLIGKVEIVGLENLDLVPGGGSCILAPNHPNYADIFVMPYALDRKARFMAARGVMQAFGGLGGLLVGPMGAFAADLDRGKGAPALRAGVKVVSSGQILVMFPEGWTYLDGVRRAFKKGAVRIARLAQTELGKPSYIVPVNLRYGRYPGAWILRLPIKIQYAVLLLLFPFFRSGVRVAFGKPIASDTLPEGDSEATALLERAVDALDTVAVARRPRPSGGLQLQS